MDEIKYTHRRKIFLKNISNGLKKIGEARMIDITIKKEVDEKVRLLKMSIPYKKPKNKLYPDHIIDIEDKSIEIEQA